MCPPSRGPRGASARPLILALACAVCLAGPPPARGEGEVALPDPRRDGEVSVERALAERRSVREFAPRPLPLAAVSQLLWAAQGVTHPDGMRTAPSAGALYPLEVYLVVGAVSGVETAVYHYRPRRHRLVRHSPGDARGAVAAAALDQDWMAEAPAVLVLAAVQERTTRKYGRRAARYVHMEVGHAAQNVYLQAATLGLGTTVVGAYRDTELVRVLRLPQGTRPLALLPVGFPR